MEAEEEGELLSLRESINFQGEKEGFGSEEKNQKSSGKKESNRGSACDEG